MAGSVPVKNLNNVLNNMKMMIDINRMNCIEGVNLAGALLETNMKKHASLTDHSLKDLADMGHPYSTRKGKDSGPHPDYEVHSQSGTLQENIVKNGYLTNTMAGIEVGVLESDVPYIKYLIEGTAKMRPKDFISHSAIESTDGIGITLTTAILGK